VRVVIAEDLFLLREGLIRLLEAYGFEVAAATDNGADFLAAIRDGGCDVAVVDVRLPPTFTDEGLRAALTARAEFPGLPVLVVSQYVEQLYARELLASGTGGIGYLLKDRVFDSAQFVDAVRRVAAGDAVFSPRLAGFVLDAFAAGPATSDRPTFDPELDQLTTREREVLRLIARGYTYKEIARELFISVKTVESHVSSVLRKLQLSTRHQLTRWAAERRLT